MLAERAMVGDQIQVTLWARCDPSRPTLTAVITRGACFRSAVHEVRIVSPHPVWRDCLLTRENFATVPGSVVRSQESAHA